MSRSFVKVSRKWDNHEIKHSVVFDVDGVSIEAPLDEFLIGLTKEIGNSIKLGMFTRTVAQEVLQKALLDSVDVVIADMKETTRH